MRLRHILLAFFLANALPSAFAQSTFPLRISDDKRYLVDQQTARSTETEFFMNTFTFRIGASYQFGG